MMHHCSGDEHLLEPDDGRFWVLLRDFNVKPDGVVAIGVTIFHETLDEVDLHAKSSSTPAVGPEAGDSIDDLPF